MTLLTWPTQRPRPLAWLLLLALAAPAAQAGLFDDDEARKAILDVRQRLEQSEARSKAQGEANAQLLEQINQLKRSLLDLNNQLEQTRAEIARLRGQDEQLLRDVGELQRSVTELQRQQKDVQQGVDDRIRKLEPQKVTVDGREFLVDPEERRQYEEAIGLMRKSDFAAASAALAGFNRRYPGSGYRNSALFWLGNAQYGMREYREAISSFRTLVAAAPDHPRAPEALLAVANCQLELKDAKGARRTIDDLIKAYPKTEAAQAGKERLASLR